MIRLHAMSSFSYYNILQPGYCHCIFRRSLRDQHLLKTVKPYWGCCYVLKFVAVAMIKAITFYCNPGQDIPHHLPPQTSVMEVGKCKFRFRSSLRPLVDRIAMEFTLMESKKVKRVQRELSILSSNHVANNGACSNMLYKGCSQKSADHVIFRCASILSIVLYMAPCSGLKFNSHGTITRSNILFLVITFSRYAFKGTQSGITTLLHNKSVFPPALKLHVSSYIRCSGVLVFC
jgi:hypothetical protein